MEKEVLSPKSVFMVKNTFAIVDGVAQMLYAGQYYEVTPEQAEEIDSMGMGWIHEMPESKPKKAKVKNKNEVSKPTPISTSRTSLKRGRSKRVSKNR